MISTRNTTLPIQLTIHNPRLHINNMQPPLRPLLDTNILEQLSRRSLTARIRRNPVWHGRHMRHSRTNMKQVRSLTRVSQKCSRDEKGTEDVSLVCGPPVFDVGGYDGTIRCHERGVGN